MKYSLYLIGLALLFSSDIFAQTGPPPAYFQLVKKADTLFQKKDYQQSVLTYSAAFSTFNGRTILNERYNAACAWARLGKPDSAFFHLFKVANAAKYADDQHLAIDSDLVSIHKDSRWADLMTTVRNNKTALEAQYNQPVKKELEAIFVSDQFYRRKADSIQNRFGFKSTQMQSLLDSMKTQDKINLQKITAILDKYGWLGPDKVGNRANLALFAVIVHADLPTMEKYFPLLKDAADKNAASKVNLALLQDKIESAKYHYQTYGTQLDKDEKTNKFSFVPIKDKEHVNERRAAVGLPPIEAYAKQ
ncbi:DUF6624 domain-containing protein [Mucilaginibacter ginsenosidivorax]|uniref:Tetratricopeptide repeat protein n=1 Tax=Mucilaginibacter ginsenosidivorax TaxID=862126 RepID=A0A5B8VWZ1_9SPHI|nr:DUF6624 domain-containing protein [Mucilaginibacter ginsenosidivorax]QEC74758.1 hypothetical protein FSB76_01895 [Mucilaginibacter ginsenosidivorax]